MTLPIEKALIRNQWPDSIPTPTDSSSESTKLAYDVINGRFGDVLTSRPAKELLHTRNWDGHLEDVFDSLTTPGDGEEAELIQLVIAIALLHAFIQANWTGPDLNFHPSDLFHHSSVKTVDEDLNAKAISELAYGGEPAYHLAKCPIYLRLAQMILLPRAYQEGEITKLKRLQTAPWWTLCLTLLHQQILDETVPPPELFTSALSSSVESLVSTFTPDFSDSDEPGPDADLSARVLVTHGLLCHLLSQDKLASSFFALAIKATGLQQELTGALGKRTRFQQEDLSQLIVLAESKLKIKSTETGLKPVATTTEAATDTNPTVPKSFALNDDTLLETTQYAPTSSPESLSPSSQPALHPLDQTILLALAQTLKATSPSDPLTSSQLSAYTSRVLFHPQNWSIHTMALLSRSRLEANRTRTVERGVLQIQALVDQMPATDGEQEGKSEREKAASARERLEYFWEILLPSRWALEKELAEKFFSLGVLKSALEIYERLETWEEVVKCYAALEKPAKGIEIVKDLLAGRKREAEVVIVDGRTTISKERRKTLDRAREAKLLCILGDLEPTVAIEHYTRAWSVSGQTSGRAMRSLGGVYFSQGKYNDAIDCLRKSVKINPLVARAWFILGCACMRVEDWEGAREAFTRCVKIDEEDGESWSNLAGVYLRMPAAPSTLSNPDTDRGGATDEEQLQQNTERIPIEHKLLAYHALKQGLKFSHNNWKMWYNYMIVCVDVGELAEAARALGRVVEETSGRSVAASSPEEDREAVLDLDVVDRLVDAVAKGSAGSAEVEAASSVDEKEAENVPRESTGLSRIVTNLFENTLLPKISSSPRLFRAYARLMTVLGRWDDALKAYLDAYRVGIAGTWGSDSGQTQEEEDEPSRFKAAVKEVEEIVDVLRNFGPRTEGGDKRWKMQARSVVRTLLARAKDEYEGEEGWDDLVRLRDELKAE
ncbi:hypothetical protein F5887DRAFT_982811 [Amanita rubescens]|nr:hypothetical protein F5887DRAFT_982811 [Amanita rubescens]